MTNRNNVKKTIMNDFSKKKNYSYILKKIGENKMGNFWKVVVPSCLAILVLICGIVVFNNKELKNNNEDMPKYDNKIVINKVENLKNPNSSIAGGVYDIAGGFYEKAIEELEDEYPFINHLFLFGDNIKNQRIGEYRFDCDEISLQGYYVIYTDDTEKKIIEIFFSKTMNMKPRDIGPRIKLDELEDSYIMNTPVKIIENGNTHIAFFDKNGVHIDVETDNISQEELIDLIQSILKKN